MSAGAENVYTCQRCRKQLVTIDRDEGVTPFMMRCGVDTPPGCGGEMYSAFYPKGPRPSHVPAPTHEWYRPTADELAAECLAVPRDVRAAVRDHVRRGGLLIRPIAPLGVVS